MRMVIAIIMLHQPLQLHATLRQTKRPMMFVSYSLMAPVGSSPSRKPKYRSSSSSRVETSLWREGKVQYVPPGFPGRFLRAIVDGALSLGSFLVCSSGQLRSDDFRERGGSQMKSEPGGIQEMARDLN